MTRPVTIFTGQWADLPIATMAEKAASFGYDGLELACWGDHFSVSKALSDPGYIESHKALLAKHGLKIFAISNHLVGQIVCDPPNANSDDWADAAAVQAGPEAKRAWAVEEMKRTARAAAKLGVPVVNGFTGSSIWHLNYFFPPVPESTVKDGYKQFANLWGPILDEFQANGVKFALEVHPTEIAYDHYTWRRALEAVDYHPAFGINYDPSHLAWVGVDPVKFLLANGDRIFHMHVKDARRRHDGLNAIHGSHLQFGDPRRAWDFVSPGRGEVNWQEVFRALYQVGYHGPLSVEWEDNGMDREFGASEACAFVKATDFKPSTGGSFEDAFKR